MADGTRFDIHVTAERFQLLVNSVTDYAIYMLDADGYVATWNPGARRFKGYEPEEIIGPPFLDLLHRGGPRPIKGYKADEIIGQHFSRFYTEEDRAAGEPQRALATAVAEGKYEKEAWRVRKDGTRFWASVVLDPIHDEEGQLLGFAKITRDITERRKANEELEEARAALFQSQKLQALGELTGGVAHDFNNLMTVIRGSADLLTRPGLSEEKRTRYLQAIINTADRAATLTSHLLAFGRRQALKPEVADLNVRLDAFAEMAGRTLGGQFEVVLDLAPSLPPVEVDLAQLETAMLNAAFNARDAMQEGGRLTLSTRRLAGEGGGEVMVEIADTGSGMSREVLERAFEPFFTTKPVGEGTGLGLSQIHGFAAQAGGRAEIRSTPGEGTAVRIILPATDKAIGRATEKAGAAKPPRNLKVLLVEDNDHVRDFAHHLLDELGYRVMSAASAEEALELLETEKVDLLFSDVVMPGRSGIELARLAREADPGLPVLLASGYSEEVVALTGADFEILRKPYDLDGIEVAIGAALERVPA